MDYEKIGSFIAKKRRQKGMTQLQLAELLHVTDRAVSKWERGKSFPDPSLLRDLCEALDITITELFEGEEVQLSAAGEGMAPNAEKRKRILWISAGLLLILAIILSIFWVRQLTAPLDLKEDDFEIGEIAFCKTGEPEAEREIFTIEGEFAEEDKGQLKGLLSRFTKCTETEKLEHLSDEISVVISDVGTFYPCGYEDARSGALFAYNYIDYQRIYGLCMHLREDRDYVYKGKNSWQYQKGSVRLLCTVGNRAEEAVCRHYTDFIKNYQTPEGFPDAYVKNLDVVQIQRLTEAEYRDLSEFELIQKELEYYEPCDFRIFRVITDWTYTEQEKALIPQYPEGRREEILLVSDNNWGEGYSVTQF